MHVHPNSLEKENYYLIDTLHHNEIIPFAKTYMKKKNIWVLVYYLFNIFPALLIGAIIGYYCSIQVFTVSQLLSYLAYGFALAFTLIPLHEFIHVLAYKSVGATNTSYDANLKKFYFMAMADKFVANEKEFKRVALAPILVISFLLVLGILFSNPLWKLTLAGAFLTHSAFCSGDFALLSYFKVHSDKDVVTYDDKTNKVSYFYAKSKL